MLLEFLAKYHDRPALIGEDEKISYAELVKKVESLSAELKKIPQKKIALLADNSPEWVIFDLSCIRAGLTLIPLPHFFTKEQIHNILISEKIGAVFCDDPSIIPADFKEKNFAQTKFKYLVNDNHKDQESSNIYPFHLKKPISDFAFLVKICSENLAVSLDTARILCRNFCAKMLRHSSASSGGMGIAKITFTSGSTADPKPINLSLQNIEEVVLSLTKQIGAKNIEKNLVIFPLSILLENIAGVYLPLLSGGRVIVKPLHFTGISKSSGFDVNRFTQAIREADPTSFILSPELAKVLITLVKTKTISPQNLRFVAVGGAKVAADLIKQAADLGIPLFQGYGLSEACSVVALNTKSHNKNDSVGKVLPHLEVKILDDEIMIRSKSLAQNIATDSEGFYATGDIGYLDKDGFLFVSGRKKNIFITSMMRNVNPEWVESEILKSNLIAQTAVFGEAMPTNAAIIVPSKQNIKYEDLKSEIEYINQNLPDYAQISNIIIADEPFNQKNGMLTGNGRIRRQKIWEFYKEKLTK